MKKYVGMIGSVPLATDQLQMAPAVLAAAVRNRGHKFQYWDINIELFHRCHQQQDRYVESCEWLQDIMQYDQDRADILGWQNHVVDRFADLDVLLVNVFSALSQGAALRFIHRARQQFPHLTILVGGIGSQKKFFGFINQYNQPWLEQRFDHVGEGIFGQMLLEHDWIHGWQNTLGTDILAQHLPLLPALTPMQTVDYSDYRLDHYSWQFDNKAIPMLGSHGCVRQCSFCDVIKHFPKYSFVEADQLSRDIVTAYQQTGIARVQFMDSLVNGSVSNFRDLLKNLIHAKQQGWLPEDFSWSGTYICRPPSRQLEEVHTLLGDSGADIMVIGVETGSDRVRFEMDKKFTNQDLLWELQHLHAGGVRCWLLFFAAWPTETPEDFAETIDLFQNLAVWSYRKTVHAVSLGFNGFSLLDGTPIDDNKESIGLRPGPTTFLWHCEKNPDLDFWVSTQRRFTLSSWVQGLGIKLAEELVFLRTVMHRIQTNQQAIIDWTGGWAVKNFSFDLDDDLWTRLCHTRLTLGLVNSNDHPVDLTVCFGSYQHRARLLPGEQRLELDLDRLDRSAVDIALQFRFSSDHAVVLKQYENSDYYCPTGVYINLFDIDGRDITLFGFNRAFSQQWTGSTEWLPHDFDQHNNVRCVITDCDLVTQVPANQPLHEYVSRCEDPEFYQEIDMLRQRILDL